MNVEVDVLSVIVRMVSVNVKQHCVDTQGFCVERFYAPYINFHSFIHSNSEQNKYSLACCACCLGFSAELTAALQVQSTLDFPPLLV